MTTAQTIAVALGNFARAQNAGLVMVGDVGIFTGSNPDRVRGADVVFISHAQYERRTKTRGFLDVAPELVVEIPSPESPETEQKVIEYLAIGVWLVLVVDPPGQTISAHRPNDAVEHYRKPDVVACDDVVPGFSLPVAIVFEI